MLLVRIPASWNPRISTLVTDVTNARSSSKTIGIASTAARTKGFAKGSVSLPLAVWLRTMLSPSCATGMIATACEKKRRKRDTTAKAVEKSTAVLNADDSVFSGADASRNFQTRCVSGSDPCCMHSDCCVARIHQKIRGSKRSKHADDNTASGGSAVMPAGTPSVMPAASTAPASAGSNVILPAGWPTAATSQPASTAPAINSSHAAFLRLIQERGGNSMNRGHADREEAAAAAAQEMARIDTASRAEMFRVSFRLLLSLLCCCLCYCPLVLLLRSLL